MVTGGVAGAQPPANCCQASGLNAANRFTHLPEGESRIWEMELNRSPWPVAATGIPDPGGIAAISRWLSVSDTTGIKGQVLPTLPGSQPSGLRSQPLGMKPRISQNTRLTSALE